MKQKTNKKTLNGYETIAPVKLIRFQKMNNAFHATARIDIILAFLALQCTTDTL
jgi:hypothetical protein